MDNKIEIQHVRLIREKKDEKDRVIYREYSDGYWECYQYDNHGNRTYYRDSYGKSEIREFDKNNNLTYYADNSGTGVRLKYDKHNNLLSIEDNNANILL